MAAVAVESRGASAGARQVVAGPRGGAAAAPRAPRAVAARWAGCGDSTVRDSSGTQPPARTQPTQTLGVPALTPPENAAFHLGLRRGLPEWNDGTGLMSV